MKQIKNNPTLSVDAVKDKVKIPTSTLIVAPYSEMIARELIDYCIKKVFTFERDGKKLTVEEAIKMKLFDFKVIVEINLKETEWLLITEDEIYYSKGDNSA